MGERIVVCGFIHRASRIFSQEKLQQRHGMPRFLYRGIQEASRQEASPSPSEIFQIFFCDDNIAAISCIFN
jgi:hypothetical protein